ncbi:MULTISPECIES: hypothetical protein [unclassified Streptomyces]|uniref:hypothetical protein n=1 Tax=unclassified Streptomyces TaxID=2593676 RepID=UPI000368868A|nr:MULTISPECIES: hypothetical protein [unclassified Streptomyces]MYT33718.1 hypothetical protein [Streptomyces sp. SID8354]
MNWTRLVGFAAAGLALCGCAHAASTSGAAQRSPRTTVHSAHEAADKAEGDRGRALTGKPFKPVLELAGNLDARPEQLVGIRLDFLSRAQGHDAVTAHSPAFSGPVRLRWQDDDSYGATRPLAMTDKAGWYPLEVSVAGRTVARDRIHVVPSERPSFTLTFGSEVARPGEPLWLNFDDLYPGERGTDFTVRSAALHRPVRLVHDERNDFYNPRAFSARAELAPGLADGDYTFELYGPHGHRIADKRLTVRASRPGDADYLGKAHGPDLYDPNIGYADSPHRHDFKVSPGGRVAVMWHDAVPDPGEETRLTATSSAFTQVLRLNRDDSKSADGDDPRYFNTATIRAGLKPGRYPVTIVAHHGRVMKVGYVTVTAP